MDPSFVERHWADLPNLNRLRTEGSFYRLGTTTPPQSPVAWSSLITGQPPDEHGIFDFVHRDAATLQLYSSMAHTEDARWKLPFGPYILPLSPARVVSERQGVPFWRTLAERGVPVTVVRMPTNYPPERVGHAIAGMGTPDLTGTLGTFTLYTDRPEELTHTVSGGRIVKVRPKDGHVNIAVDGPPNPLRKDGQPTSVTLAVDVDRAAAALRLQLGETVLILKQGEWSDWIPADFPLIPHLASAHGMFRVFAKQLRENFELYVSPVNADPLRPELPISEPSSWSSDVAAKIGGRFFTLGIPEDTSALRSQALTHGQFLEQARLVFEDEEKLFRHSIASFTGGFLFFYVSSVDQNSHVLWGRYDTELLHVYAETDRLVGEARSRCPNADLIVMSDHGFARFDRATNLNTWLLHRGFLTLKGDARDDTTLSSIDWAATDAYAVGLNGLYVNQEGREAHGTVKRGPARDALLENLREQLFQWRDPVTGKPVVTAVERTKPAPRNRAAPDLIVGYNTGYRASWQTGVGATPSAELHDNSDAWIADHCIDPSLVPGVLFLSKKQQLKAPKITDVTSLILEKAR